MYFDPIAQREFAKHFLGPALKNNTLTAPLKLMIIDDNRNYFPNHADIIFNDPEAAKYIDGIALHWYSWWIGPEGLALTNNGHLTKFILATEACNHWSEAFPERWSGKKGPHLGNWTYGEYYAQNIIEDLENSVVGWIDWNMVLDETGGPSWIGASTDASIIANASADEFYKQPMYYVLAHFSKFVRPGAIRVGSTVTSDEGRNLGCRAVGSTKNLCATASLDPATGQVTVVLMNRDPNRDYRIKLGLKGKPSAAIISLEMERNSIATVVFNTPAET